MASNARRIDALLCDWRASGIDGMRYDPGTGDAGALHNSVRETRLRAKRHSFAPEELLKEWERQASGAGLEVVVRKDAVFVGDWGAPIWFYEVQAQETWVKFQGEEGYHIPEPRAPGARTQAERIAGGYAALYSHAQAKAERQFQEARARPSWNNRLL
jgi:hypothetical protein